MGPTRSRTWLLVAVVAAAALLVPGQAQADPSLDEIEGQIDEAWRELEPLIEEHNRVRSELKDNRKSSDELADEIAPLELKHDIAEAKLADIVAHQYRGGAMSAFNSLLASGSPTAFVDQLAVLDFVARGHQQQIEEAAAARREFAEQKAEIDALIKQQREQEADLEQRTERIEGELARLEGLREEAEQRQQEAEASAQSNDGSQTGSCPAVSSSGAGATAAEFACAQLGKPYQWGANGPDSYDCSGLTQQAWAEAGVSLSHYTGSQWSEGQAVSRDNLVPGDLVFFYSDLSHVGLYVGAGLMVDAPRAGENVQMRDIDTMPVAGFRRPA